MSSAECQAMIDKFQSIKNQVSKLFSYLDSCEDALVECKPYVEEIIIDSKPIDEGKLSDLSLSLTSFKDAFVTVIGECDLKISMYEAMKTEALAREESLRIIAASRKPVKFTRNELK